MGYETGKCKTCGTTTIPPMPMFGVTRPAPTICYDCNSIATDDDEISTDDQVRCPKCRHVEKYYDDNFDWCEEGTHDVTCGQCGHDYEISTTISFSFTSPAMLEKGGDNDES